MNTCFSRKVTQQTSAEAPLMRTVSECSCWERCFINTVSLVSEMPEKWLSEHPMKPRWTRGKCKELVQAVCNLLWLVPGWTRVHCGPGGWGQSEGLVLLGDKVDKEEAGLQVKDRRLQQEAGAWHIWGVCPECREGWLSLAKGFNNILFCSQCSSIDTYILSINKNY